MHVAITAGTALRNDDTLSRLRNVGDQQTRLDVIDFGAARHRNHEVLAALAVHLLRLPRATVLRVALRIIIERKQRIDVIRRREDDIAATAAVTSIWTSEFDERLTTHGHGTIAAASGPDQHLDLINKRFRLHDRIL